MASPSAPVGVTEQCVEACQVDRWYPQFKAVSLRTEIVPLPEEFVDFLLQDDGLFLPASSQALPRRDGAGEWEAHDPDYASWSEADDNEEEPQVPEFPALELEVNSAIVRLGGAVLPKLNWSCPKDASWLSSSATLRCTNAAEVVLLLKGSDSIQHDLRHAFDTCSPGSSRTRPERFVLALRRWLGMRPEMEFRCFIRDHELIGISQREVTTFYPVHADAEHMSGVEARISNFFSNHIQYKFEAASYTMDIYVTCEGKVKLVDFNPFGEPTLPLLFEWEELILLPKPHESSPRDGDLLRGQADNMREQEGGLVFRVVENMQGVRPSLRTFSGVPFDLRDNNPGGSIEELLLRLSASSTMSGS